MKSSQRSLDDLYRPSEDTFLLLDSIESLGGRGFKRALEIGSGTGIVTEALCRISREVYAVDISRNAVLETWRKLKSAGLENISHIIEGDLLSMFREAPLFDLIVSNPPYLPLEGLGDKTVEGGIELIRKIIDASTSLITQRGIILLVASSLTSNLDELISYFNAKGLYSYIKMSRKLFFEEIVIIEATKED
ncbi:MAG: methyltransferase [Aigarchaeota archaeon]|nr:methyltransferase [Aigarchaeota archaeon]MDW7986409.1 methyltransferase [Nitrososphaerota archaeon]